jgi:hypothetical protein
MKEVCNSEGCLIIISLTGKKGRKLRKFTREGKKIKWSGYTP